VTVARNFLTQFFSIKVPPGPLNLHYGAESQNKTVSWDSFHRWFLYCNLKVPFMSFFTWLFLWGPRKPPKVFLLDSPCQIWLPAALCSGDIFPGIFIFTPRCIMQESNPYAPWCSGESWLSAAPCSGEISAKIIDLKQISNSPLHHAMVRCNLPLHIAAGNQTLIQRIQQIWSRT
jgi:hypothetical protein